MRHLLCSHRVGLVSELAPERRERRVRPQPAYRGRIPCCGGSLTFWTTTGRTARFAEISSLCWRFHPRERLPLRVLARFSRPPGALRGGRGLGERMAVARTRAAGAAHPGAGRPVAPVSPYFGGSGAEPPKDPKGLAAFRLAGGLVRRPWPGPRRPGRASSCPATGAGGGCCSSRASATATRSAPRRSVPPGAGSSTRSAPSGWRARRCR